MPDSFLHGAVNVDASASCCELLCTHLQAPSGPSSLQPWLFSSGGGNILHLVFSSQWKRNLCQHVSFELDSHSFLSTHSPLTFCLLSHFLIKKSMHLVFSSLYFECLRFTSHSLNVPFFLFFFPSCCFIEDWLAGMELNNPPASPPHARTRSPTSPRTCFLLYVPMSFWLPWTQENLLLSIRWSQRY